jgi:outer membrane protein assembly factor BamD (BamD/ComL family)
MDAQRTHSDSYYNFLAWLEVNKRKVMIWAAAVLFAVLVAIVVVTYQRQKEQRASEALSNVHASSTGAAPPAPGTAEAYLKVAREHAGTGAGSRALLLGAVTKFQEGAYPDAQKYYEQFMREYPESRWLPIAYFGVASSLDAQGKTAEATKQFEQLRRQFPNDAVADETKLALARLYESQNRPSDAYKLYDELVKANPYSGLGSEAGLRQADLVEKHPELARTNLPPAMTTMPPLMMTNPMGQGTNRAGTNRVQIRPLTNTMQRPATNLNVSKTQVVTLPLTLPTNPPVATKP